jgi:hypothetical protein
MSPKKWTEDGKPHICYFLLNFGNGVHLDAPDQSLSASIIILGHMSILHVQK